MSKVTKTVLVLLLMAAVIGYTIFNYVTERTDPTAFLIYMVILSIPFVNMVNILIQELKNR